MGCTYFFFEKHVFVEHPSVVGVGGVIARPGHSHEQDADKENLQIEGDIAD